MLGLAGNAKHFSFRYKIAFAFLRFLSTIIPDLECPEDFYGKNFG